MAKNKWRIKEAVKLAEEAGLKALRTGAEAILTEAINETPIETGTLRRSGTVTVGSLPDWEQVYEAAESGSNMKDAFPGPECLQSCFLCYLDIFLNAPFALCHQTAHSL